MCWWCASYGHEEIKKIITAEESVKKRAKLRKQDQFINIPNNDIIFKLKNKTKNSITYQGYKVKNMPGGHCKIRIKY